MLASQRLMDTEKYINQKGCVTMYELQQHLNISSSTLLRDLSKLHHMGKIYKVHGGAMSVHYAQNTERTSIKLHQEKNKIKEKIAYYAASLVDNHDTGIIFLDTSKTIQHMIEFLPAHQNIQFVTNSIINAHLLAKRNYNVLLLGGKFHASCQATVGEEAIFHLSRYYFNIGFFGADSVSIEHGYSTTNAYTAPLKQIAINQCQNSYVLADASKLEHKSAISFASFTKATLITNDLAPKEYAKYNHITFIA